MKIARFLLIRISKEKYLDPDPFSAGSLDPENSTNIRDIKRLPTTPISLVLRKNILAVSERLSRSTLHLIEGGEGGEGSVSVLLYSVVLQP